MVSGQCVGYIRVSSLGQNPERQLEGLEVDRVFTDTVSGKSVARPALSALLAFVRDGDVVIAHSMDRLARNLDDLRRLVRELTARGVQVRFVKEQLSFTGEHSPLAELLLSVLGALDEMLADLISEGTLEGLEAARARGRTGGRKPKLTTRQAGVARQMYDEKGSDRKRKYTVAEIAETFHVSRKTIYRHLGPTSTPSPT